MNTKGKKRICFPTAGPYPVKGTSVINQIWRDSQNDGLQPTEAIRQFHPICYSGECLTTPPKCEELKIHFQIEMRYAFR